MSGVGRLVGTLGCGSRMGTQAGRLWVRQDSRRCCDAIVIGRFRSSNGNDGSRPLSRSSTTAARLPPTGRFAVTIGCRILGPLSSARSSTLLMPRSTVKPESRFCPNPGPHCSAEDDPRCQSVLEGQWSPDLRARRSSEVGLGPFRLERTPLPHLLPVADRCAQYMARTHRWPQKADLIELALFTMPDL